MVGELKPLRITKVLRLPDFPHVEKREDPIEKEVAKV
jgi:hypothetical protein